MWGDDACFAYGSLMWADIRERVCGRPSSSLPGEPASVLGYARWCVRGEDYPGLRPAEAHRVVTGVLFRGLTPDDWVRLDAFEGAAYERLRLPVVVRGTQKWAWAYCFRDTHAGALESTEWSPDHFERAGRERFLQRHF